MGWQAGRLADITAILHGTIVQPAGLTSSAALAVCLVRQPSAMVMSKPARQLLPGLVFWGQNRAEEPMMLSPTALPCWLLVTAEVLNPSAWADVAIQAVS